VKTLLLWLGLVLGAVAAGAQPVAAVNPQPGVAAFVLGAQDQIEVNVASYPDLRTVARIAPDGTVILPLVGSLGIAGKTPAQAGKAIEALLVSGGYVKQPMVRVEVLDVQSRKASVLGQVNNQGLVVLDRDYSVAEILAKAGGLAPDAADTAVIVRQPPAGGSERITIDIGELMAAGGAGALTRVQPGDVVFVARAPTFSVIGAVNRPGTYPLRKSMTVEQALAAAGDINNFGSRSKVKIRRTPAEGAATVTINARIEDLVQPGDVLNVGERVF
jgi:polysaccharide export outer membrane protein